MGGAPLTWWQAYLISCAGNMTPLIPILIALGPVSEFLRRHSRRMDRFFIWMFTRTKRRGEAVERRGALGLIIFVAIPLPVTGGWTGAMAAFLMGIPFGKSMLYILMGVMIAGVIMTVLALLGWVGAFIAAAVLLALAAGSILKNFNNNGE